MRLNKIGHVSIGPGTMHVLNSFSFPDHRASRLTNEPGLGYHMALNSETLIIVPLIIAQKLRAGPQHKVSFQPT